MFDFISRLLREDSRSELEKYIEDELAFRERAFIKYAIIQARFDVNPVEKTWFLSQVKTKQGAYVRMLFSCENQSGKETIEEAGKLHYMSPEYKKIRDRNMRRYGLHLWGEEFLRFHSPQLR
ncbi:hypothetical protein [Synechococcus elongatus]|uniref:Uncharacterized protein n=1 Tax=Synechococcus elongatus PCC 11802 TaxID=2283154 RepID=A0AAT9K7E1_SYNEL|nr:hypothetical protein [Synechococcus elongatus]QFZ93125.1 hypothetical protein EKO22_13130 [Synechococcus elongatus PCC 11802]